jgi:hypothetical protein
MHLIIQLLDLFFLDYNNVKPLKSKISIYSGSTSKIYFSICIQIEIHILNLLKHAVNHLQMHHMHVFLNYSSWM